MKNYISQAVRTESPVTPEMEQRVVECIRPQHSVDGLTTEVGELSDAFKRYKYYGKEVDKVNVKEEIGDLLWYVALMCDWGGWTIEEIMEANIAKLKARFPHKFTEEDALNRNLDKEREILES